LCVTNSSKIKQFNEKYGTTAVPTNEDVIIVLLKLKSFSASISNTDLAAHVHTEMNNLLNFLLNKKTFDFFKLGTDLQGSGPLGRDIVVCVSYLNNFKHEANGFVLGR
jgi:hypothetical protein